MKLNRKPRAVELVVSGIMLFAISCLALAESKNIVVEGKSGSCYARDMALKLAHISAVNNAHEECSSIGSNWRYDRESFSGYEQCKPCGSSKEYACFVTQALFVCRTRK